MAFLPAVLGVWGWGGLLLGLRPQETMCGSTHSSPQEAPSLPSPQAGPVLALGTQSHSEEDLRPALNSEYVGPAGCVCGDRAGHRAVRAW